MSEFEFVAELPEPLPQTRPPGSWGREKSTLLRQFAAALRAHPGEWAVWPSPLKPKSAGQIRARIRRDVFPALPPDEFEGRAVNGIAYVRYIGTAEPTIDGPEDYATDLVRDEQIGVGP